MSFSKKDCEILSEEVLYQGFYRLMRYHVRHKKFSGEWSAPFTREIFETPAAVAILPYDPQNDKVVLIEQFRTGALQHTNPWIIEMVSGLLSPNEPPMEAAKRETMEEAGCTLKALELIQEYLVSPGNSSEYLYLYCGWVDASSACGIHGLAEENEDIRVLPVTTAEAFALMRDGKIKAAHTIMALQWLQLNQARLKTLWSRK